ncbi:MAG: thiamine pyrophosphate-dependent enzyme [Terriglobia bacterium]
MGDFGYRTREEAEEWKARCPVQRLRKVLLEDALSNEAELQEVETAVNRIVEEAHQFGENSPWPDPATVTRHIYSESVPRESTVPLCGTYGRP